MGTDYTGLVKSRRTPLTADLVAHDVDVSWWVTPPAYDEGYYDKLYAALRTWVVDDFPFQRPHFSNVEIPSRSSP
jgi:hypothetical protein